MEQLFFPHDLVIEEGRWEWRLNIKVQDHQSSCANPSRLQYSTTSEKPFVSQDTRTQENAKLEREHLKLQSSLKMRSHGKVLWLWAVRRAS